MAKLDILLEQYLTKNTSERRELYTISESEKTEITKSLVDSIFRATAEKAMHLDYTDITVSSGDITKIKDYVTLKESISMLNGIQSNLRESIPELVTINQAHNNIIQFADSFAKGFKTGNPSVTLLYNNITLALITSVSFTIATSIDYIKDPLGSYDAHFRNNLKSQKGHPTIMLDSLEKFNKMAVSGELYKFFEFALSKKAGLSEAATFIIGGMVIGSILLLIVPLIREIVYQFFHMRVSIADYLRLQSEFLEMNRAKIARTNGYTDIAKKQKKISETLIKIADKIDVDQKSSSKRAEMDLSKENKSLSLTNPSVSQNLPLDNLI